GGLESVRINDAYHRLIKDDFYVPLDQLTTLGMGQLQRDERIRMLYSQSSGLTWFLMHYDSGRYRDALVDYLHTIYAGRDRLNTLAELTGASFAELDRQYREFISGLRRQPPE